MTELDLVVLKESIIEHGLVAGDVGTVVHRYSDEEASEVEFVDTRGTTIAVLTLEDSAVRPPMAGEILHVRDVTPAAP
ncbi:MAG: DUF4926 domain-containing protein [Gemmatimonadota bacterium]|nr:DUF4926 domain-containing protein [Gemmatimonadota bacterium]